MRSMVEGAVASGICLWLICTMRTSPHHHPSGGPPPRSGEEFL